MRKRYKIVLNVEIDEPDDPAPAGGDYTHLSRLQGILHGLSWCIRYDPAFRLTIDKVIDKGEIKSEPG